MKFSVLIANYNNARFLSTAIESVLNQSYSDWEIILVDDGSTDCFHDVIKKYISDKRVVVFSNSANMGCGYTKKRCAELATGDIMGFLDPDDKLNKVALQTMADAHLLYPNASIVHSTHYICDETLTVKRVADYVRELPAKVPYLLLNDGRIHHFATFKRNCYQKTQRINDQLKKAVDQDLYYKLEETGDIIYIPQPLYYYRLHQGGISTQGNEAETAIIHYQIVRETCLKRILQLNPNNKQDALLKKAYRVRYHKISAFYWSRRKKWLKCLWHLAVFPLIGGAPNIVSYLKKIPTQGIALFKKSFVSNYQIK